MPTLRRSVAAAAASLCLLLAGAGAAYGAPVTLTPVATDLAGAAGVDFHEPAGSLVVSLHRPGGPPWSFELLRPDGTHDPFSGTEIDDRLGVATVRSGPCQGGFAPGETFSGTAVAGQVLRLSPDGGSAEIVPLPGEPGLVRDGVFHDRFCATGGRVVVTTTAGNVWRIGSTGDVSRIAAVGSALRGVITLPDDFRYGPLAGNIVAAGSHRFFVIDPRTGTVSPLAAPDGIDPRDLAVIPAGENFFGSDAGSGGLVAAEAAQWHGMVGDLAVAEEAGRLSRMRWNGTALEAETIAGGVRWGQITFAPIGVANIPPPGGLNRPPHADAGADAVVEQTSPAGADHSLDGSLSVDPDGDALDFEWSGPFGTATGATPTVRLPPGTSTITLRVSDGRGGVATDTVDVTVRDTLDPTIVGGRTPAPNAFGWNAGPVEVRFSCSDGGSGIASCSPPTTLASEGANQSVTGEAVDHAGNSSKATVGGVNIDLTDPEVAFSGNAGTYDADDRVTIGCTATDRLSGLAESECPEVDRPAHELGAGTHRLEATAEDRAGNVAVREARFEVVVTIEGLRALVERFVEADGPANSLSAKLRAAEAARERGDQAAYENVLAAFRREVRAQAGRHGLTDEEAEILLSLSRAL